MCKGPATPDAIERVTEYTMARVDESVGCFRFNSMRNTPITNTKNMKWINRVSIQIKWTILDGLLTAENSKWFLHLQAMIVWGYGHGKLAKTEPFSNTVEISLEVMFYLYNENVQFTDDLVPNIQQVLVCRPSRKNCRTNQWINNKSVNIYNALLVIHRIELNFIYIDVESSENHCNLNLRSILLKEEKEILSRFIFLKAIYKTFCVLR